MTRLVVTACSSRPSGRDPVDGPVIHREELAAMLRPREEFLAVEV
jgi:hypothetical protein